MSEEKLAKQETYTNKLRETLEQKFYNYLIFDRKATNELRTVSAKGSIEFNSKLKEDAKSMANLVILELNNKE
jgi:hypothetical protein